MKVVAAFTLWSLFSAWLLFPHVGAPRMLRTAPAVLLWVEFLALLVWGYASQECSRPICASLAETARTAAAIDIPVLTVVLLAVAAAYVARALRIGRARTTRGGGLRRTRS